MTLFVGNQVINEWQDKGGRFAGPGLRTSNQVFPFQDQGDGLFLYGTRFFEAHSGQTIQHIGVQPKPIKSRFFTHVEAEGTAFRQRIPSCSSLKQPIQAARTPAASKTASTLTAASGSTATNKPPLV